MSDFGDLSSVHEHYSIEPSKPPKRDKRPLSRAARAAIRRKDRELTKKLEADEEERRRRAANRDPNPRSHNHDPGLLRRAGV